MSQDNPREDSPEENPAGESASAEAGDVARGEPQAAADVASPRRSRASLTRQLILLGLLALMLLALWYDYKVARPNVENAYATIEQLNMKMNSESRTRATLNTDIHAAIQRQPSNTFKEGPYQVEVFSWSSGLPFRTHNLYAVYMPRGGDQIFMRQYKFELPRDELDPEKRRAQQAAGAPTDTPEGMMDDTGVSGGAPPGAEPGAEAEGPGPGGPGGRRGQRGDGPPGEGRDRRPPLDSDEAPSDEAPSDDGEARPERPAAETPADDTPAESPDDDAPAAAADAAPGDDDAGPPAEENDAPDADKGAESE